MGANICLRCCFSSDIISLVLRERVGYLKGEEGDLIRDEKLDTAKKMIAFGKNTLEGISKILNLPLSTVEELASSMQKKDRA